MDNAVSIGAPLTQAVAAGTSARETPLRNNGMWGGKIGGRNPLYTSPPLGPRVPLFNNPLRLIALRFGARLHGRERKEGRGVFVYVCEGALACFLAATISAATHCIASRNARSLIAQASASMPAPRTPRLRWLTWKARVTEHSSIRRRSSITTAAPHT